MIVYVKLYDKLQKKGVFGTPFFVTFRQNEDLLWIIGV